VETQRHPRRIPVDDHADEREERDAAQFRQSKLRQRPTILRREVGQIVGELVEPIDTGTRGRYGLG
jgi:NTP pyrophosphatase (non-canonical NTP hydrolase)